MLNVFHDSFDGLWICENEDGFVGEDRGGFFINLAHQEETEIRVRILFRVFVGIEFWVRIMIGQESECRDELADSRRTSLD